MANHKSAKKRIIRNANRAEINKSRISRIRTFIKKVENAITSGDQAAAQTALKKPSLKSCAAYLKAFCTKTPHHARLAAWQHG